MTIECRSPSGYITMPWRNGLGTTTELARQDHDAGLAETEPGFIWRISRADIVSDGAFSNFSGVDRILLLLSGNGLRLEFGATGETLTSRYQTARFAGDHPVYCRLTDGPCQDLNIMVARAYASAATTTHDTAANSSLASPTILHAMAGDWAVEIAGVKTPIAQDSLVIISNQSGTRFRLNGAGALLQIDIHPVI